MGHNQNNAGMHTIWSKYSKPNTDDICHDKYAEILAGQNTKAIEYGNTPAYSSHTVKPKKKISESSKSIKTNAAKTQVKTNKKKYKIDYYAISHDFTYRVIEYMSCCCWSDNPYSRKKFEYNESENTLYQRCSKALTSDEVRNAFGIFIEEYGLKGAEETKLADDFAKYVSGTTAVHGLLIRESCFTKSKEEMFGLLYRRVAEDMIRIGLIKIHQIPLPYRDYYLTLQGTKPL